MSATVIGGPLDWTLTRDENGQREYSIKFLVECTDIADGPYTALRAIGLPQPGESWNIGNDQDAWAYATPKAQVTPVVTKEPGYYFEVLVAFTTRPQPNCQDSRVENPLLQPQRVSITFNEYTEEITTDRFGKKVTNSAHSLLKGPVIEFDKSRIVVRIEQNVVNPQLPLIVAMNDTVNATELWGIPKRCIKLKVRSIEKNYYAQCSVYWTRVFEFEIRYEGFDRNVLDEAKKMLKGKYQVIDSDEDGEAEDIIFIPGKIMGVPVDPDNPNHFVQAKDREGNPVESIILNGRGVPAGTAANVKEYYASILDNNLGNPISDPTFWMKLTNFDPFLPFPEDWIAPDPKPEVQGYPKGQLVYARNSRAILISANDNNKEPPIKGIGAFIPNTPAWISIAGTALDLTRVAGPFTMVNQGDYRANHYFHKGDFVRDQTKNHPGSIRVEYYRETDFRLLNIPLIIDMP